jgi:acyl-[acyl-carrier-protein]-phospholipid O-acyltransferase / long-chain-fatty-acid--[acyl-carrier-protein] ligase
MYRPIAVAPFGRYVCRCTKSDTALGAPLLLCRSGQPDMTNSGSYSEVLARRGVQPFLWMQFLNAFNENMYKLVVSLLAVVTAAHSASGAYLSLAGLVFIAPFLLFSGYAGQLVDKFEKRTVVLVTKAIEIPAMVFALVALMSGSIEWMLAVLFFTAVQAAFFSPAKYGMVPELVPDEHLARANGLLQMSTFIAIILGSVGGSYLVAAWRYQPAYIGAVLVGVALLGTAASLKMVRTPAPGGCRPFSWNPLGDVSAGFGRLVKDRALMLAALGTTYFWFLGALFQMILLLFAKEALHSTETQTGMLMAALAIGIGIGSMAAGRLSGDDIETGLVPIGALGMAIAACGLAFTRSLAPALACLGALGFAGGLFVVPLNATLQHNPGRDEKGRVLGTANFVNTLGIMLASGVVWSLHERLHLSAAAVIAVSAAVTLLAAVYALTLIRKRAARVFLYLLTHAIYRIRVSGKDNVPRRGPALLVANHVSYVDGLLVGVCLHRILRFLVTAAWYDRFCPVLSLFDAIRVPNGDRRGVVKAIELAREELQQGHLICIFAEGALTLNGNIGEFHRGLERIVEGLTVEDRPVPVVPVHVGGIWGSIFSRDPRASLLRSLRKWRPRISVSFGQPMTGPSAFQVRQAVSELGADAAAHSIDPCDSLGKCFIRTARSHWRRRALTDSGGRTLTYGEALTASRLFADHLCRTHSDERMFGIMLPASVAAAVANLGIVLAGRIPVNLNFTIGREALDSAIEQCGLKTIFTSKQFLAKGKIERRAEMIFLEDVMSFGKLARLVALLRARLLPVRSLTDARIAAGGLAAVLFSSGSTGAPKGVMLSHRNLISNTDAVNSIFQIDETDTIAGVLPFFHSFGFTYTLWFPLLNGASAAYHPQPLDAKGLGELVQKSQATLLPAPPTFCQAYLRGCSKEQFASLRYVLVGAEKLQPSLAQAFKDKFGLDLLEGYGATEMSPVISVNVPDREWRNRKQPGLRPGSVGLPLPGVAARVVDPETGEHLDSGEPGLLLVKGANRMMGYLNRPGETEAALRDEWYVTGDIAQLDKDGFIHLVDRQSRFSKIGGEMVPHGKIEESLTSICAVPCAVTSVSDANRGERLVAFVVGNTLGPQEIWQRLMASGLPKLWIPKRDDIHLVDNLPTLGTGKLDLRALKQMAREMSEAAEAKAS